MKFASAAVLINPPFPTRQAGHLTQTEKISTVHDDLHARLLYLEEADQGWLHLSVDNLGLPLSFQEALQKELALQWNVPLTITVSCTHSHHCGDPKDEAYRAFIYQTVIEAARSLKPEEVGPIYVSRRSCYFDGVGKSRISHHTADALILDLIDFSSDEKPLAEIILHNVHPTILQANTPYFSAEYPGYVLRQLSQIDSATFFTFMQSADGDVSTRFTRSSQDYAAVEELGSRLVKRILELRQEPAKKSLLSLSFQSQILDLKHEFDPIDLNQLPKDLSEREKETIGYGQVMREKLREHPEQLTKKMMISCVNFGSCRILFAPNELFSWYLGEIDRSQCSLACYSNGYAPYVTGPDQHLLTYETFTDTLTRESKMNIIALLHQWGK